jgi:subtilisin family serine protease
MKQLFFALLLLCTLPLQAQKVHQWYQDGVLIFQVKTDSKYVIPSKDYEVNIADVPFVAELVNKYGIEKMSRILYYHPDEKLNHTYQIDFNQIYKIEEFINDIARLPFIEYAEKKELHVKFLVPNDLGANSSTGTGQWHLHKILAQQAWDLSTGSVNIIVAVTDDAIKTTHPDLVGKFVAGNDATDQTSTDPNPCGANDGNHGTHVSGIVGANTNNATGVASIGWNISIMPVKIGRCSDGALTAGYEGLAWAANNGADVINMSWGGGGTSTFGQNAVTAAFNQGSILVAAAGNDGTTSQLYPAAYTNVIAVASTTTTDARSSFSQYGTWIDISSPGSGIRSTVATGNTYDRYDGTSMASPLVSGLLGLMKSYAPNASNTDLINCLYSSADPVTSNAGQMGAGRINAFDALQCVGAFSFQTDAGITNIASPASTICGSTFTPQITLRNFGSNPLTAVTINYTWGTVNATFNWTGNLSSGQSATVTLPLQTAAASGNFTFTATTNLAGDQNNANNSSSKTFAIDPNGQVTNLTLTTDCYGSEVTWEIRNSANQVVTSGGPYTDVAGGQTFNISNCLPVGCYTFNIADSYGDGMYGSQYGGCTVNGNYVMTGANGANLFQMTATNANFGNGTSHSFCIVAANINNDCGISEVLSPKGISCSNVLSPQVRIRNFGNNNLTTATISYNVGGANQTFNWTGNLSSGQTALVTLPNITSGSGAITFTAFTTLPNGIADQNNSNNQSQSSVTVYSTGLNLPYTESFETNTFTNGTWSLSNPDNDVTWQIATIAGTTPGSKAAKMDFFNYAQAAQRDGMISPMLNFNGYSSITMTFEHAYRRFNQTTTDSLVVYVSTNCGTTWQRVLARGESGTGTFATAATSSTAFTPAAGNWCTGTVGADCYSIDLTSFAGNNVLVKFEGYNSGTIGNNLFVDNINITGVALPFSAEFTATPTSLCAGQTVTYTDQSIGTVNSRTWSFPSGTPASSTASSVTVTYPTAGVYNASLSITGPSGTDTETKNNYITVNALPTANITGNASICSGASTLLTANATAGSGTISTYQWKRNGTNVGSNQNTFSATQAGTYTVVVTNSNTCSITSANFVVSANTAPTVSIVGNNSFCIGASTLLTANATAGSGTISSYQWKRNGTNIGSNQNTLTATQAGTYTVVVTNSNTCSTTSSNFVVSTNALPTVSIVGNTQICPSGTTLTANATAGSGSISTYQWKLNGNNVGSNSSSFVATQAGFYTVTVTNSNNCTTSSANFNATLAPSFPVTINTTNASCGATDGSANANVNGGTAGYNFVWNVSPSIIGTSVSNLASGSYTVNVTQQATGCVQIENFTINNSGAPVIDSIVTEDATCFNNGLGNATFYVSGGTGALTYNWGLGASNSNIANNLSAANYNLAVSDALGCQSNQNFTINSVVSPTVSSSAVENATCPNLADGSISLQVNGGSGVYSFTWNNGATTQNISNLSSGSYSVSINDANGCSTNYTVNVANDYQVSVSLLVQDNSASQGISSIIAEASNGVAPYQYSWNSNTLTGDTISNLASGSYLLTVSDANGCLAGDSAYIGTIGIEDLAWLETVSLYPNPVNDFVKIHLSLVKSSNIEVSIISILGQRFGQDNFSNFTSGELKLPTNKLSAGMYFVKITKDKEFMMLPFLKVGE